MRASLTIGYILCRSIMASEKVVATNREAYHNYHILETYECGIALTGTEVKSIREGRCNLKDSYGLIRDGEAWLLNAHISPYSHGNRENHEPTRTRKLLLHRREIDRLARQGAGEGTHAGADQVLFQERAHQVRACGGEGQEALRQARDRGTREADREARAMMKEGEAKELRKGVREEILSILDHSLDSHYG